MRKQSILNEFQQKLKTSTFFQKILYSFLLIASICLTVFCLCIVSFINKNQQSFLRDLQDNTISRAYNVNQTALKDIIRYCDTMMGDYTVKSLLYSEEHDVPMMLKCNDICDSICKISSMIDSVYFVNYNSGTVLSSAGSSAIDRFRDQEVLTLLEDIVPSQSPQVCCPRMVAPGQPGSESIPMLTLIYRYSKQGAMVLNLNYQTYSEMLYPDSSEYLSLIMVNQDDVVFFSSDPVLWGCNYREDETYRTIGSFMNNRGTYTHTVDGTEYTVKYIKNSGFGITYLCLLQNTSLYLDMSLISAIQIYVTVSLLLAIVLSIIMSFINYRPIKHLKSYVDSQLPDSSAAISGRYNEFRYFFDRYQKLLNVNKQYENRLNEEKVQKI